MKLPRRLNPIRSTAGRVAAQAPQGARAKRADRAGRSPGRAPLPPRRSPSSAAARAGSDGGGAARRKPSFTGRAAVLAVVVAALAIALAGPLRQLISQRAQLASMRDDVKAQQQQLKQLQDEQKRWTDPAYIAAQARDRLHYVKPGEIPYVTLSPTPKPSSAATPAAPPVADQPWYAQLWGSIEGADAAPAHPSAAPSPSGAPSPSQPSPGT